MSATYTSQCLLWGTAFWAETTPWWFLGPKAPSAQRGEEKIRDHKRELSVLAFLSQRDICSGFPGIQKARRRMDLWPGMPGSRRHHGLCWPCPQVKVPALQPHQPCQELAPAGTLAAAKQRDRARLVPALSPCGRRCCLVEAFCEEGGDDVLFRRQVVFFSFHLKDSLKCGGY